MRKRMSAALAGGAVLIALIIGMVLMRRSGTQAEGRTKSQPGAKRLSTETPSKDPVGELAAKMERRYESRRKAYREMVARYPNAYDIWKPVNRSSLQWVVPGQPGSALSR